MESQLLIQLTRASMLMERESGHLQLQMQTSNHTYSMTQPMQAQSSMVSMDTQSQLELKSFSNINLTSDQYSTKPEHHLRMLESQIKPQDKLVYQETVSHRQSLNCYGAQIPHALTPQPQHPQNQLLVIVSMSNKLSLKQDSQVKRQIISPLLLQEIMLLEHSLSQICKSMKVIPSVNSSYQ